MAAIFQWQKQLGAGQFGEVWLAIDTGLNTERAVKIIPPSNISNTSNFFQEAQILKATEHPNVVHVEETGELDNGRIYIAMEYLPAGSVERKIKNGYLDLIYAKKIMIDTLRGLEYAHSQDILHRDIKPANILIGHNSEGKLSDFGLAILMGTTPSSPQAYISHLAPEVYSTHKFTVASDIYACGATLYRLVNGDSYFPKLSPPDTIKACISGRYPNRNTYRYFIPKSLKIVINKALNVDPQKRYQSAQEMRHALERIDVKVNWVETKLKNTHKWKCRESIRYYEVTLTKKTDNYWAVTVKKGRAANTLRKITSLCETCSDKSDAERITKRVLQDIVLGKQD